MFKDNLREGLGSYTWPNNLCEYTGPYSNGLRHSGPEGPDGTMIWRTKGEENKYIGKWSQGFCTIGQLDGFMVDLTNLQ